MVTYREHGRLEVRNGDNGSNQHKHVIFVCTVLRIQNANVQGMQVETVWPVALIGAFLCC